MLISLVCTSSIDADRLPPWFVASAFYDEFASLFEMFAAYNCQLYITGDLNTHFEDLQSAVRLGSSHLRTIARSTRRGH